MRGRAASSFLKKTTDEHVVSLAPHCKAARCSDFQRIEVEIPDHNRHCGATCASVADNGVPHSTHRRFSPVDWDWIGIARFTGYRNKIRPLSHGVRIRARWAISPSVSRGS